MSNHSAWGGNAIKGPDGLYHLFFSWMVKDGLHQYKENCLAAHAVSESLLGPYSDPKPIRGVLSHNVQPQLGPDGDLYIFMIGLPPGQEPSKTIPLRTIVGHAANASSAWEWVTPDLLDMSGAKVAQDNPTAIMYANGSVLLATRGITKVASLFFADNWRGPYKMVKDAVLPCGNACIQEDPFLWQSPRGLHLLFHNHVPFPFHKQVITYAFTPDVSGRTGWVLSGWEAANGTAVKFDDGSTHTFCSRQRPQLHFSEPARDGVQHGRPLALFTGVQHGELTDDTKLCGINNGNTSEYNPYADYSFTFAQPIVN